MDLSELKKSISLCKEGISVADQNLEKLTGRNAFKNDNFIAKPTYKRHITEIDAVEIKKPRTDRDTPALHSVVQVTRGRTRDDALTELTTRVDSKEKERCRRLFGHFMGTLSIIKKESEKINNDPQTLTRRKIEKKVEETNKIVSETIKREQNELLKAKKERLNDLKVLNQRYRAAEAFERWSKEKEKMKGFIRTSKPPYIFYLPKVINDETRLRIDQTVREIESMIESRRKRLEAEISRAMKLSEGHLNHDVIPPKTKESMEQEPQEKNVWLEDDEDDEEHLHQSSVHKEEFVRSQVTKVVKSPAAQSCASEDYDDMIDEIEISMHDEAHALPQSSQANSVLSTVNVVTNIVSEGPMNGVENDTENENRRHVSLFEENDPVTVVVQPMDEQEEVREVVIVMEPVQDSQLSPETVDNTDSNTVEQVTSDALED